MNADQHKVGGVKLVGDGVAILLEQRRLCRSVCFVRLWHHKMAARIGAELFRDGAKGLLILEQVVGRWLVDDLSPIHSR